MRQMMLANDDLDVHSEVVFVTEDLYDATLGIIRWRWPRRNLHIDHHSFEVFPLPAMRFLAIHAIAIMLVSRLSRVPQVRAPLWGANLGPVLFRFAGTVSVLVFFPWRPLHSPRNDDLLGDLLIDRSHEVVPRPVMKRANDRRVCACQHPQNLPLDPPIVFLAPQ